MELTKLFEDSLSYPTKDWNKVLKYGVIIFIMAIVSILGLAGIILSGLSAGIFLSPVNIVLASLSILITTIVLIFITLIISGYNLSIIKNTINNVNSEIPDLELAKNFVDGLKVTVLYIVYSIIPIIIGLIIICLSFGLLTIVSLIICLAFATLFLIAKAILAETGSLAEALNIVNVYKKIDEIEWGDYLIWLILAMIILMVISIVISFIMFIPLIGIIAIILIIIPYVNMFGSRALGLIYNESKTSSSNHEN